MEGGLEGTKVGLGAWVGAPVRTDDPLALRLLRKRKV